MPEPVRSFSAVTEPDIVDPPATTALDELRSELAEEVATPDVVLPVKGRAGYSVRYSTGISHEQLAAWQKRARDRSKPGELDELKWASIILANQCRAIVRKGVEVELAGDLATFSTPAFREAVGAETAVDAVRKFYGRDSDVLAASGAVLREAGYGEEVDADPTTP